MISVLVRRFLRAWSGDEFNYDTYFACPNVSESVTASSTLGEFNMSAASSYYSRINIFAPPGESCQLQSGTRSMTQYFNSLPDVAGIGFHSCLMPCSLSFITVTCILCAIRHFWDANLLHI